jgi:predicted  nucleic acid-binding Zn-ribbon protein
MEVTMSDREDELLETVASLQDEIEKLKEDVAFAQADAESERTRANDLEIQLEDNDTVAPAGSAELQDLARTIRQCQKNGHPDYGKHVDTLLRQLGA